MLFGLIFLMAIMVFLAFFVGKNLDNTTTIWFFKSFENVSVIVLVLISFAVGIVLALICLMIRRIMKDNQEKEVEAKVKKARKDRKAKKAEIRATVSDPVGPAVMGNGNPVSSGEASASVGSKVSAGAEKTEKKSLFKKNKKISDDKKDTGSENL